MRVCSVAACMLCCKKHIIGVCFRAVYSVLTAACPSVCGACGIVYVRPRPSVWVVNVCMCVCVYACMCVCVCAWVLVRLRLHVCHD